MNSLKILFLDFNGLIRCNKNRFHDLNEKNYSTYVANLTNWFVELTKYFPSVYFYKLSQNFITRESIKIARTQKIATPTRDLFCIPSVEIFPIWIYGLGIRCTVRHLEILRSAFQGRSTLLTRTDV